MSTYEHGKADADAPVTYTLDRLGFVDAIRFLDGTLLTAAIEKPGEADEICRALHLAKLAEEIEDVIDQDVPYLADWLRRYRAAKGEA